MRCATTYALVALCAGCAATNDYSTLASSGAIRFSPATTPGYSYDATFLNALDFGYDSHKREDRVKAVAALLGDKCKRPILFDESEVETGKLPFGRPVRTQYAKVRCG